jgi:hypothetical protein
MARKSPLVKVVVGLTALAIVGFLFVRSVRSTRAEPYVVERQHLTGWSLVQSDSDPVGAWLALRPRPELAASLGTDIFRRGGESVNYPNPAQMPLLLQAEYDRAFDGMPAEVIVDVARAAGLESVAWEPRCMAYRRISEPRATRGIYFVLFNQEPFSRFRQQLAELLRSHGHDATLFDPEALSPALLVAGLDGDFGRWMPLRANPDEECLAPIDVM